MLKLIIFNIQRYILLFKKCRIILIGDENNKKYSEEYSKNNILKFNAHYRNLDHFNISNIVNIHFADDTKSFSI